MRKGQVSFEFVLISAVVIALGVGILAPFFTLTDETTAMAILKENALKKLSGEDDFAYIELVKVAAAPTVLELSIYFCPFDPGFGWDDVKDNIARATRYPLGQINIISADGTNC